MIDTWRIHSSKTLLYKIWRRTEKKKKKDSLISMFYKTFVLILTKILKEFCLEWLLSERWSSIYLPRSFPCLLALASQLCQRQQKIEKTCFHHPLSVNYQLWEYYTLMVSFEESFDIGTRLLLRIKEKNEFCL